VVRDVKTDPCHLAYHDTEYGFPLRDDNELFQRLILEINQAGLSWTTILKKREGFRAAYAGFDIGKVAAFGDEDRKRLMADASIIRNRLKINAAITNANTALRLIGEYGSLAAWLDRLHPLTIGEWAKIFKKTFVFTGGEIVREFLLSTGYLRGAHEEDCPVYGQIAALSPPWCANQIHPPLLK
jgi:DNA-3-methyladenine glycosylase I